MIIQSGTLAVVTLVLVDASGSAIEVPDWAVTQYRLMGPNGVLSDWSSVGVSQAPTDVNTVKIVVPSTNNYITTTTSNGFNIAPAPTEARLIQWRSSSTSTTIISADYLIATNFSGVDLTVMLNSFQTYPTALNYAAGMTDIDEWTSASYNNRITALISSYFFISRLNFEIYYNRDNVYYRNRASWNLPFIGAMGNITNYTASDFEALDPDFVKSVRMAQVAEANARLGGNDIDAERIAGFESRKSGDTSHAFRKTTPLNFGVSRAALKYLRGYVKYTTHTSRV